jgi:hypothetical protein
MFDHRDVYANHVRIYCQFRRIYEPCLDIQTISKNRSLRSLILLSVVAGLRSVIVSFSRYARESRLSARYTKALRAIAYPAATLYEIARISRGKTNKAVCPFRKLTLLSLEKIGSCMKTDLIKIRKVTFIT